MLLAISTTILITLYSPFLRNVDLYRVVFALMNKVKVTLSIVRARWAEEHISLCLGLVLAREDFNACDRLLSQLLSRLLLHVEGPVQLRVSDCKRNACRKSTNACPIPKILHISSFTYDVWIGHTPVGGTINICMD